MIHPIYVYGMPVLRKVALDIDDDYEGLDQLIEDMYETMYNADNQAYCNRRIQDGSR
jgi:peptide deformylase